MGIEDDAVILQFKSTLSCENWTALFRGWEGTKQKEQSRWDSCSLREEDTQKKQDNTFGSEQSVNARFL